MIFTDSLLYSTDNQRLTALNAQAFENLVKLDFIELEYNYCISWQYYGIVIGKLRATVEKSISDKCGFDELDFVEIVCERIGSMTDGTDFCDMSKRTAINATNFILAELRDEEITAINFKGNKRIEYLPYKIYMHLPNLALYEANECSVKQITKENFEKLIRLEEIWLSQNKIQKISGDTFKGLESLHEITLGEV